MIKQISIFVENKFGRLAKITETLGENGIDISALSLADTTDFGVLRLIVDKPELAVDVLRESGVAAKCTEVVGVALKHSPGGVAEVLKVITENDITIEYMYAFVGKHHGKAMMVVKTDDMPKTAEILPKNGIEVLESI